MIAKITGLVALAAVATATNVGGACVPNPGTTTPPTSVPTTTTTKDNCSTRTICLDYVNECGMWYGGCVPDCKPLPTFSKPTCPPGSSTTTPPTSVPTTTTKDNCSTRTICLDYVNECGMWYGGCVPDCKPLPTFSKPTCPPGSSTTKPVTTTPPTSVPTTTTKDNCSTRTICLDYINECGIWYGGCVPDCKPWPTFQKPPCPSTTTLVTSTRSA